MNQNPHNDINTSGVAEQPTVNKPKRNIGFFFIGLVFPLLHYTVMLVVQLVAKHIFEMQSTKLLGPDATLEAIEEKAYEMYMANAELFSIISGAITILTVILAFVIVRLILKRKNVTLTVKETFSFQKPKLSILLMTALLAFCFYHIVILFIGMIGTMFPDLLKDYNESSSSLTDAQGPLSYILQFIAVVIMAPVCEELIYRNMTVSHMRRGVPLKVAVIVSAAIFGLAHGQLLWILYATALGILFGILYVRTDSIFVSVTAHFVFNLVGFLYSLLPSTENWTETQMMIYSLVVGMLIMASLAGGTLSLIWLLKKTKKPVEETVNASSVPPAGASCGGMASNPPYTGMPYGNPDPMQGRAQGYSSPYAYSPYYNGLSYTQMPQSGMWYDPQIGGYRTLYGVWHFHAQYGWQFFPYQFSANPNGASAPKSAVSDNTQVTEDPSNGQSEQSLPFEEGQAERAPEEKVVDVSSESEKE